MLLRVWKKTMNFLMRFALLFTFLSIVFMTGYVMYNVYYFNPFKIVAGCIVIYTFIHTNKSLQG
ncbi:MAG: hypothetical protein H0Z24_05750 [Thermosipho sp. (in: Bacteria)]|nr:hypothetical protein [Thermosipho sp. (in: thermotogales)]